jgi:hypothetical protein
VPSKMAVINGGQTLIRRPTHAHGAAYFAGLTRANAGGAKGTRTPNPLLAKQVRYQLRHGPVIIICPGRKAFGFRPRVVHPALAPSGVCTVCVRSG